MDLLINILLVASPFLGASGFLWLFYAFYGRKVFKIKDALSVQGFIIFLMIITLASSPLIRPTATPDVDQSLVHQLEAEAAQVIKVEELVLEDKEPETEVRTKYKKFEPEL